MPVVMSMDCQACVAIPVTQLSCELVMRCCRPRDEKTQSILRGGSPRQAGGFVRHVRPLAKFQPVSLRHLLFGEVVCGHP